MRKVVALGLLTLMFTAGVFAQAVAGLGAVSGTVRDASGAVVPGAVVVLSNESKGIKRTLQSTDAGVFAAPALVPAAGYSLAVDKQGFANWEVKNFPVEVGRTVDFKVVLEVAATSTKVEVNAEALMVEDTKSGVSQVVNQAQIDGLPINGRRADTFVLLTPAVVPDGTFGLVGFRGISMGNSFLTDGNDTTNSFYNENAGRTRIQTQISQDAVQEFQVLSDGFSAEFGRALGGVINTVTRGGTNDYHGTGYWFFRNRSLNAPDRYALHFNPPEYRHQAGGSFGGPIKKDKLFFFSNFETVQRNFPGLNRIINSAFTDPSATVVMPSACGAPATPAQCATAIKFIQKQMNVWVDRSVSSAMGFAKLDWRPTDRNAFSVDLNVMHWRSPHGIQTQGVLTGGNMLGNNGNSTVETRYGKASWTSLPSSNSVNELRFGWFKDRLSDPAASDLWPAETGGLYVTVAGSTVGAAQAYPRTFPSEQRYQFVDNYSWTHGAHSAKFGVDYQTTEDWMSQLFNYMGNYTYSTLSSFAADFSGNSSAKNYSSMGQAFGNPVQDLRTSDINFYAQDTWKVSKKVTFNYGIRYEKTFIPQPTVVNPDYPATGKVASPNKDFAPRASLSYALGDRTVLRAGYGIFWARFNGNALDTLFLGNGKYQTTVSVTPTTAGAPVFPRVFASAAGLPSGTINLTFADSNFHNPYTQQGTLALEHQLTRDMALTASYIWSRGIGLWTKRDLNLAAPTVTKTYTIQDTKGAVVGTYPMALYTSKLDSHYANIFEVDNGGQSWYNALALQLRKRMSHGLTLQASYTWSHAIDDAAQNGGSAVVSLNNLSTFNGNYAADKGSSGLDQRHRAVISFLWQPRFTKSTSTGARFLVNGWGLSTLTTLASAQPAYASVTVSGQQFTGVSTVYTSTMNGSGGWTRVPFWPVNNIDIDRTYRVDARLTRDLPFGERVKAFLMFEAFNAFNTQYNTGVQGTAFTASGGILKPQAGLGWGNQSQGFPDGSNARRCQVALRFVF